MQENYVTNALNILPMLSFSQTKQKPQKEIRKTDDGWSQPHNVLEVA